MKMIYVYGDDFAALEFENQFNGKLTKDVIDEMIPEPFVGSHEFDDFSIRLYEFDEIDPQFIEFIRRHIQDHDQSKNENFYFEDEII